MNNFSLLTVAVLFIAQSSITYSFTVDLSSRADIVVNKYPVVPCQLINGTGEQIYSKSCPEDTTCTGYQINVTLDSESYEIVFCEFPYKPWLSLLPCKVGDTVISTCDNGQNCTDDLDVVWGSNITVSTVSFCEGSLAPYPDFSKYLVTKACSLDNGNVTIEKRCRKYHSCNLGPMTFDSANVTYEAKYCIPDTSSLDVADPVSFLSIFGKGSKKKSQKSKGR